MMRQEQRMKASAHIARSGMGWPKSNTLDVLVDEREIVLEWPRRGTHESDDAVFLQVGNGRAQPATCPE
jgi:hypothetical protein